MAKAVMESNKAYIDFEDGEIAEARFRVDPTHGSNLLEVVFFDKDGVEFGTPIRFKGTDGGSVAADFPGVGEGFATQDGKISNG
jgi:PKD repeat protein